MDETREPKPEYGQRPMQVPAGATEVLLVRHGQSAPYRDGEPFALVDGQGDPPLSDLGHRQAERVGERLRHAGVSAIYVTNLTRTHQTAAPLAAALGIEPVVEAGLREVHLGDWEGGEFRRMAAEGHPAFAEMERDQDWAAIPGAEPVAAVEARVRAALEQMHRAHPDQRIVAVSHGGAIGAAVAVASGSRSLAFATADNASITHLILHGDRWIVRRFNDTNHLGDGFSSAGEGLT